MKAGDLIEGRYRLEAMLGRGGMGVVWQALDGRLERRVALKLLHPANAPTDPAMHARFAREARLLATLDHPAVVSIYDYSAEHEPPYLVMQLIDGHTLEGEVANAPLDQRRVRRLLAPVADALAYAHGRGIVHRDLKPANVLLDRDGRVRVTDFGLARLAFGETSITVGAQLIGSPEYWAPEQAAGRDTSTAADLYALGVILYLLASGELPFPVGEDRIQAGFRRVHEDAPPLALAAPGLPRRDPDLLALCDALLAREPTARPTAAETAERLRREPLPTPAVRRKDAPTVVVSAAHAPTAIPAAIPTDEPTPVADSWPLPAAASAGTASPESAPARPYVPPARTGGGGGGGRRAAALALLGLTLAAGTAVAYTALDEDDPGTTAAATTGGASEPATAASEPTTAAASAEDPAAGTTDASTEGPEATESAAATTDPPPAATTAAADPPPETTASTPPPPTTAAAEEPEDTPDTEEPDDATLAAALPAAFRSQTCRFRHPDGWSVASRDARRGTSHVGNVVRSPNGGLEVVCDRDQRATSVTSIANRVRGLYRGRRGYDEVRFEPATIAGREAYLYEYTDGPRRFKEAFFAPGVALRVQAPAGEWGRYERLADQILASYDGP